MNPTRNKTWNTAMGLGVFFTLGLGLAPAARAGCGDVTWAVSTLNPQWADSLNMSTVNRFALAVRPNDDQPEPAGADIVGMWAFTFTAKNSPPFPDGTTIDFGFAQWHSDGTEITNSGGRDPRTGNFCLGVWKKTGPSSYKLNHKGLSWDPVGNFIGPATIGEEVAVDRTGQSFSGTFTIDQYDTHGNLLIHIAGVVTGNRIGVD